MPIVSYVGDATIRKISRSTLLKAGFSVPRDIVWSKENGYQVDVADPTLVAFLVASGGFSVGGISSFVDAIVNIGGGGGGGGPLPPLVDTAANLASTNPTPAPGRQVLAVDTEQFGIGDGNTKWNDMIKIESSGRELAHASCDTQQSVPSTMTDIADLDVVEFKVGSRPVYVELYCPWVTAVGTAAWFGCTISDLGNANKATGAANMRNAAGVPAGAFAIERIDTPGTYSRKGRMQSGGNPGATLNAGITNIFTTLRVIER